MLFYLKFGALQGKPAINEWELEERPTIDQ